jgi:serine/threonine-protein kinase
VLDTASGEIDHTWPDVLPNGKAVLFTVLFNSRNGVERRTSYSIAVADVPSGKHRVIVNDAMYSRYASSGHLLYVTTNKTLMVVPFDQNSMKVVGEPSVLTEGMRLGLWGSADLAVSAAGTLVYATGAGQGKQELVWVTRNGKAQAVDPDWPGDYLGSPALSPDGKWLAVARVANAEPMNIWIKRLDRGPSVTLTLEGNNNFGPAWTPDGRSVTFSSDHAAGATDLWTERADGGAPSVMQLHEKRNLYNAGWSPDGKWLIFRTDVSSPGSGDILAIRPGIDTAPVPVVATRFTEMTPALSPNGRWLAYVSNETGEDEIYVVPFPNTGAGKWAISAGGGTEPLWSHSGSELFYRAASGDLVAVAIHTQPRFSLGHSAALFPTAGFTSLRFAPQYAVAPGDRRFLMIRTSTPDKLIVVENWFEELRTKSRK